MTEATREATVEILAENTVAKNTSMYSGEIIADNVVTCKGMKLLKVTGSGVVKFNNFTGIASVTVAKKLAVRHFDLLKNIKKAEQYQKTLNDKFRSVKHNFSPIFHNGTYKDPTGRTLHCKVMNLHGFKALVKVIDTQEAYNLYAVMASDSGLIELERTNRADSKIYYTELTDALRELYFRLHKAGSTQIEKNLYTNFNKKVCIAIAGKYEKAILDKLEAEESAELTEIRIGCLNNLEKWFKAIIDPREIRAKLWALIDSFSLQHKVA